MIHVIHVKATEIDGLVQRYVHENVKNEMLEVCEGYSGVRVRDRSLPGDGDDAWVPLPSKARATTVVAVASPVPTRVASSTR